MAKTRAGPDRDTDPGHGHGLDLDRVLADGLAAARRWEQIPVTDPADREREAETASGALVLLDTRLRAGAPLPSAWAR